MNRVIQQRLVQESRSRTFWLRRHEGEDHAEPQRTVAEKPRAAPDTGRVETTARPSMRV
jgi:hypothetical protein